MDILGFSLNLVSFLAITLSTGILVDDAIVEIENIVRHMRMGKTPYRAALEAADEIGLAVIAISLTIIAIFAPASFMSGIAGQFFKQFASPCRCRCNVLDRQVTACVPFSTRPGGGHRDACPQEVGRQPGVTKARRQQRENTCTDTVMPNCLKNCPAMPDMKLAGAKIAMMVSEIAITARPISSRLPGRREGRLAHALWRTMFSISTMASSTRIPVDNVIARKLTRLSEKPRMSIARTPGRSTAAAISRR